MSIVTPDALTITQMNKENGLQFRTYVPTLMELLEDADGMVRDAAKSTVIELFKFVTLPPIYLYM